MPTLRHFFRIVDHNTVFVTAFALASTWVAESRGLAAEMPTTIISIAVIFPITFSINAAYVRREEALRYFASLKASAAGLYYAHRDWLPGDTDPHAMRGRRVVRDLIMAVQNYLSTEREEKGAKLSDVYGAMSAVSHSIEEMRAAGMSGSEVSRVNQYLRMIVNDFELMRNIAAYRTPVPLAAYSRVFLNLLPVVFAPYFAWLSINYYTGVGYAVGALYAVVLVSLANIQEDLEDPFDGVGEDDVRLDVADFYVQALG